FVPDCGRRQLPADEGLTLKRGERRGPQPVEVGESCRPRTAQGRVPRRGAPARVRRVRGDQPLTAAPSSSCSPARSDAPEVNLLTASVTLFSTATGAAAP